MHRLQPYVYEGNEFSQDFAAITTVKVGAFNCSANVAPAHLDLKDGGVPFYHLEDRTVAIHDQRFSPCNLHLQLIYDSDQQQQQQQHDHRDQGRGGGGASAAGTAGAGAGVDLGSGGGGGGSAGAGGDAGIATFATAVVVGATACVTFHCIPTTEAAAVALSAATTDPGVQTVAELMQALKRGATASSGSAGAGAGAGDAGKGGDSGEGADGGVHSAFLSVHAHLSKFIHAAAACT